MHSKIQSHRIFDKNKNRGKRNGFPVVKKSLPVFSPLKITIISKQSGYLYTVK